MIYDLELKSDITLQYDGQTVIEHMSDRFTYRPREHWLQMIASGDVFVDGKRISADFVLREGMCLSFVLADYEEPDLDCDYHKVFENDNLIIVSKPANLPISSNHRFFKQNMTALLRKEENLPDINPIHRLDRETSGLMIYLKKPYEKPRKLRKDPRLIILEKNYLAVVRGVVPHEEFSVNVPLKDAGCPPVSYKVVAAAEGEGKEASTEFKRLAYDDKYSLLLCRLNTGRKHQIRAHLSMSGFPIVGDKLYSFDGKYFMKRCVEDVLSYEDYEELGATNQLLHAYSLKLDLPDEGIKTITSEHYSHEFAKYLTRFEMTSDFKLKL